MVILFSGSPSAGRAKCVSNPSEAAFYAEVRGDGGADKGPQPLRQIAAAAGRK